MRSLFLLLLTVGLCLAQDSGEGSGEGSGAGSGSGSGNGSQESHEGSGTRIIGDDPCNPQLDLIFLLDTSGSIEQVYKEHARWTVELADALPVDKDAVRIATIQYAGFPLTEFALGTYTTGRDVVEHLKQISFQSGVTRTGYALRKADSELFRDDRGARRNAKKAIVLFTDGLSIDDPIKPAEVLRDEKNVSIYVVSVSADGFVPEMQRIAGNKERTFGSSELERLKATLLADVEESRVCEREGLQRVIPIVNGDNEIEPKKESLPIEVAAAAAPNTGSAEVIPLEKIQPLGTARPAIIFTAVTAAPIQVQKEAKVTKVEFTFPTLATASLSTLPPLPTTTREAANPQSVEAVGTIAPFPPQTVATATTDTVSPVKVKRIRRIYRRRSTTPSPSSVGSEEPDEPHAEPSPKKVVKVVKVFRTSTIAAAESSSTTLSPLPTAPASTRAIFTRRTLAPAPPAPPVAEQSLDVLAEQIEQQADRPLSRSFTTTRQYSTRVFSTRPPARAFAVRNSDGTLGKGCPKDILFIVDSSGSVQSIYDQQKEYLLSVLSEIDVAEQDHRVALIQFAGAKLQKTEWSFDRFNDKNDLMRAFDNVRHFTGTTYIGAALELARQLLDKRRPGVPAIVVLVSDGFSQDDAIEPAGEILKQRNLELYATSITEQANPDYLTQITQDPNNVFIGEDKTRLRQLLVSRFTCAA